MSAAPRCPRFDRCNAPVCPLDPQWPSSQHLKGEAVCGLLCELVKVGGKQRLEGTLSSDQLATLVREWPKVESRWSAIRSRLKAASQTGSRIGNARARFLGSLQGSYAPSNATSPLATAIPVETPCDGGFSGVGA
jgi:hypothetical protein